MANIIGKIKDKVEEGIEAVEEAVEDVVDKIEEKISGEEKPKAKKKSVKSTKKKEDKDLEKAAEEESLSTEKKELSIEDKKKALLEKVAKLKEKVAVDSLSTEDLKEQIKLKKRSEMLIPLEEYVKAGIYLGTKVVTPDMKPFVYRRRADGLAILNTDLIDEKLKEGIDYLAKFNPEDVILVCKRQAGWNAAEMFSKYTGIRVFTKKYPAGILTNTQLPDFFENELTIISDSWLDKNALHDTLKVHKKVLMICDTNNFAKGAEQMIIGNNKSPRSLGVIFYLLAKGYCKAKGIDADLPDLDKWIVETE